MTFLKKQLPDTKWGEFPDLAALESSPLNDGCFSVVEDEGLFDFYLEKKAVPRLFVLFSGARDPAVTPLPQFDRWSWSDMYPGSVLCVSDPTLHLDPANLRIGWYIGTEKHDWLKTLAKIVSFVAGRLGVASDQIVCYGSSAGGFGAMMLAAELRNATAIAINPQIEVSKYSARFVQQVLDVAFSKRDLSMLRPEELQRFSVTEKFKQAPDVKCLIVQNIQDQNHYRIHFSHFCETFGVPLRGGVSSTKKIVSTVFYLGHGQGPEPKELAPALIERGVALSRGEQTKYEENDDAASDMVVSRSTIRRLRIAEEPVWIDVVYGALTRLEMHADVRGWPADSRATALLLFQFEDEADPAVLVNAGIAFSKMGPCVSLGHYIESDVLKLSINIPGKWLRRIGFQLSGWKTEVFLDDLRLTTRGGAFDLNAALRNLALFRNVGEDANDVMAVDLLANQPVCGPACDSKWRRWYGSMDAYNNKTESDLGRTDGFYQLDKEYFAAVTAFHARPAMLHIPSSVDAYFERIGDKSRNMVRKARRSGYRYVTADPNEYIDDIVEIRTSAPVRQGKAIPGHFYERPEKIIGVSSCIYHGDCFYGVFKDNKLVAYATFYLYGQLAQVNHLLGHADYLKDGIMNLLMYEVVNDFITNRPWIRAINYLYPGSMKATSGTPLFKRSMGFEPWRLLMAHGDPQLADFLDERRERMRIARESVSEAPQPKVVRKLDSAELAESLFVATSSSRDEALATLLAAAIPDLGVPFHLVFSPEDQACASPRLKDEAVVVVDGVDPVNVTAFLSAGFKQFKNSLTNGTFLLFDFPRDIEACSEGLATQSDVLDPLQKARDYFLRRFKSLAPTSEAVRDGFKGSDFVLRGIAECPGHDGRSGCSVLLLKKIR